MTTNAVEIMEPRFNVGEIRATPAALAALRGIGAEAKLTAVQLVVRHIFGDWGDLSEADKRENEYALNSGGARLLSAYHLSNGVTVWIITEADRSVTTLLLPSEY